MQECPSQDEPVPGESKQLTPEGAFQMQTDQSRAQRPTTSYSGFSCSCSGQHPPALVTQGAHVPNNWGQLLGKDSNLPILSLLTLPPSFLPSHETPGKPLACIFLCLPPDPGALPCGPAWPRCSLPGDLGQTAFQRPSSPDLVALPLLKFPVDSGYFRTRREPSPST